MLGRVQMTKRQDTRINVLVTVSCRKDRCYPWVGAWIIGVSKTKGSDVARLDIGQGFRLLLLRLLQLLLLLLLLLLLYYYYYNCCCCCYYYFFFYFFFFIIINFVFFSFFLIFVPQLWR